MHGGGVRWNGDNGIISGCTFNENRVDSVGAGLYLSGDNGTLTGSSFTNNTGRWAAAVRWSGSNGNLTNCIFNGNSVSVEGGAIAWSGDKGIISSSSFINNNAARNGGAIYWTNAGSMVNCNFVNSKWNNATSKSNGIFTEYDLTIKGGRGIVDIVTSNTISGISIVVLNNETYYYPPNTNINLPNKE
nr:hypothetical protein [uncultured Methanobrevibacter sp.]